MKRKTNGSTLLPCFGQPIKQSQAMFMLTMRWMACNLILLCDGNEAEPDDEDAKNLLIKFSRILDIKEKQIKEEGKELYKDAVLHQKTVSDEEMSEELSNQLDNAIALEIEHLILEMCAQMELPRHMVEIHIADAMGNVLANEDFVDFEDEDGDEGGQQSFEKLMSEIIKEVPPSGKAVPFPVKSK